MLKSETRPAADCIDAGVPNPGIGSEMPSAATAQATRSGSDDRSGPSRFVTGARAILFLSLVCWVALLGMAALLFG